MRVSELKEYVETHIVLKYVVNMFHAETPDTCCVVLLGSTGRNDKNTGALLFQFLVRSSDPELAELKAFEIYNHFNNKTDYVVGSDKVVVSRGQQAVPLYTGTDDKGRHIYSVNIEAMIDNN